MIPNIGFTWNTGSNREAAMAIPSLLWNQGIILTLRENSHLVAGSKLYNALPFSLRSLTNISTDHLKKCLDLFLSLVPDRPIVLGLTSDVLNIITARQSNRVADVLNSHRDKVDIFNSRICDLTQSSGQVNPLITNLQPNPDNDTGTYLPNFN